MKIKLKIVWKNKSSTLNVTFKAIKLLKNEKIKETIKYLFVFNFESKAIFVFLFLSFSVLIIKIVNKKKTKFKLEIYLFKLAKNVTAVFRCIEESEKIIKTKIPRLCYVIAVNFKI